MNLEDIIVSEINQSQETSVLYVYFYELSRIVKFIHQVEWWFPGVNERRKWGINCSMGKEFQLGKMKKILEWTVVIVAQKYEST